MFSYGKATGLAAVYTAKNMTRGASRADYTGIDRRKRLTGITKLSLFGR